MKTKFGDGYHLDIKTSPSKVQEVKDFVDVQFEQRAILEEEHQGRLTFKIPQSMVFFFLLFFSFFLFFFFFSLLFL